MLKWTRTLSGTRGKPSTLVLTKLYNRSREATVTSSRAPAATQSHVALRTRSQGPEHGCVVVLAGAGGSWSLAVGVIPSPAEAVKAGRKVLEKGSARKDRSGLPASRPGHGPLNLNRVNLNSTIVIDACRTEGRLGETLNVVQIYRYVLQ